MMMRLPGTRRRVQVRRRDIAALAGFVAYFLAAVALFMGAMP